MYYLACSLIASCSLQVFGDAKSLFSYIDKGMANFFPFCPQFCSVKCSFSKDSLRIIKYLAVKSVSEEKTVKAFNKSVLLHNN